MTRLLIHPAKIVLLLLLINCSDTAFCQADADSTGTEEEIDTTSLASAKKQKPELFTSGFIDIFNSGQVNASARFLRLNIGEPGKFSVPLSFYSGVSSNNFQSQSSGTYNPKSNTQLIIDYINPLSGLINVSSESVLFFKRTRRITKPGFTYQVGERLLTGYRTANETGDEHTNDDETVVPVNFFNTFGSLGLYFQTGAWEKNSNNENEVGLFWLSLRLICCYTSSKQIKKFLPDIETNGIYVGYSFGFGVEINSVVNIKVLYYKYIKQPEIAYYPSICQFSFNYCLKN
jgi:hypothetical protein